MKKTALHFKTILLLLGVLLLLRQPVAAQQQRPDTGLNPLQNKEGTALSNASQLTDIHDIKPIERFGFNPALLWYAALGAVILALLATGLVYWRKHRKKQITDITASISPQEAALNQLDDLQDLLHVSGKQFYFRLSMVLREYIRQRFGVDAPEMTTEELLPRIAKLKIENGLRRGVREFVYASDPVKFADRPADVEIMKQHLEFVREFVEKTAPLTITFKP